MKSTSLRPVAVAALLTLSVAAAQAVTLVGLTSSNEIARFDSASPAMDTRVSISGLDSGDRFVGIDLRPSDNRIYGVTLSNRIYTVDESSGMASFVANLSSPVVSASLAYGIDFNPAADFSGGSSLRLVSSAGSNFAINAGTGAVGNAASNIGTGYTAVAYTNSVPMPTMAPPSTALYYVDSAADVLRLAPGAFNAPTIGTVGPLGIDVLKANGFEITGNGQAFAALNVDDGSTLLTGIYGIDLATGAAISMGSFNGTLSGLTVSAVPEPSTYALLAGGLGIVGVVARRRRREG